MTGVQTCALPISDFVRFYQDDYTVFQDNLAPVYFKNLDKPEAETETLPTGFRIDRNYPNPFYAGTKIPYEILKPEGMNLTIRIFNLAGDSVRSFTRHHPFAGKFYVEWDGLDARGRRVPSGLYTFQIVADGQIASRMMVYLK